MNPRRDCLKKKELGVGSYEMEAGDSLSPRQQTEAHQAPPSLGFSRQEHWSGLPFPSPTHPGHLVAKSSGRTLHAWLHLSFFKLAFLTLSSLSKFSLMYFLLIQLMNDTAIHSVMFKKNRNSQVVQ